MKAVQDEAAHVGAVEVATQVNEYLQAFFETQITKAQLQNLHYAYLWEALRHAAMAGGKRLRPYMAVLAYSAFSGQRDHAPILPVAVALELLHICMLVHDDIIDEDYIRHGTENVAGLYLTAYHSLVPQKSKLLHYADSAALIGGDLLLSSAYLQINSSTLNSAQKQVATELLGEMVYVVCGGELLDSESAFRPANEVDALQIARLKTAHYSFVSPLVIGATLAGAAEHDIAALRQFGTSLGIAYQLTDDLLGLYGNEAVTGKSSSSDLRQGKRTYMMLRALETATTQQRSVLQTALGNLHLTDEHVNEVRTILEVCGARQETENLIDTYAAEARLNLTQAALGHEYIQQFEELVSRATKRTF